MLYSKVTMVLIMLVDLKLMLFFLSRQVLEVRCSHYIDFKTLMTIFTFFLTVRVLSNCLNLGFLSLVNEIMEGCNGNLRLESGSSTHDDGGDT